MEKVTREAQRELKRMFNTAIDDVVAYQAQNRQLKLENDALYEVLEKNERALLEAAHRIRQIRLGRRGRLEAMAVEKYAHIARQERNARDREARAAARRNRIPYVTAKVPPPMRPQFNPVVARRLLRQRKSVVG